MPPNQSSKLTNNSICEKEIPSKLFLLTLIQSASRMARCGMKWNVVAKFGMFGLILPSPVPSLSPRKDDWFNAARSP